MYVGSNAVITAASMTTLVRKALLQIAAIVDTGYTDTMAGEAHPDMQVALCTVTDPMIRLMIGCDIGDSGSGVVGIYPFHDMQ